MTGWHSATPLPCPSFSAFSVSPRVSLFPSSQTQVSLQKKSVKKVLSVQNINLRQMWSFLTYFLDWHYNSLCSLWMLTHSVWAAVLSVSLFFLCFAFGSVFLSLLSIIWLLSNFSLPIAIPLVICSTVSPSPLSIQPYPSTRSRHKIEIFSVNDLHQPHRCL